MNEKIRQWGGISSFGLHLLAMLLMLADHLWAAGFSPDLMTWLGRIAFPIFAFLLAEGYRHTRSRGRYAGRLLLWALLSEIPFDLFCSGRVFNPFHQNVLWTFLIALLAMHLITRARQRGKRWLTALVSVAVTAAGFLLATLAMTDYYGFGVLTVLTFYFFGGRSRFDLVGQLLCLVYINCELMGGLTVPIELFGRSFELPQQAMALLALIPIRLYRGEQGPHHRAIRYGFYAFYPLHLLALFLLAYLT